MVPNQKPIETLLIYAFSVDKNSVLKYLNKLIKIKPDITGNDLQTIGIKQGAVYKEIFDFVLKEKINKPSLSKSK